MARKIRTPAAGTARVLGNDCLAAVTQDYSAPSFIVQRLSRRFGISPEVAGVLAQHAGLGPQEVRR